MKNLLSKIILTSSLLIFPQKASAQSYDSTKAAQVASHLKDYGFFIEGSVVGKKFKLQIDAPDTSVVIDCPMIAEKQFNFSMIDYDFFVGFNEKNPITEFQRDFLNSHEGLGFIMDNNEISPKQYADSIKKLLKITPNSVEKKNDSKKSSLYMLSEIYPSSSNREIKFDYNIPSGLKAKIVIYDILGRKAAEKEYMSFSGKGTEEMSLENLRPGAYFLDFMAFFPDGKIKREIKKFRMFK